MPGILGSMDSPKSLFGFVLRGWPNNIMKNSLDKYCGQQQKKLSSSIYEIYFTWMAPKVYSNLFYMDGDTGSTKVVSHIESASPRVTCLKFKVNLQK